MGDLATRRARVIVDIDVSEELLEIQTFDNGESTYVLNEYGRAQLERMLGSFTIVNTSIITDLPNSARADLPPTKSLLHGPNTFPPIEHPGIPLSGVEQTRREDLRGL